MVAASVKSRMSWDAMERGLGRFENITHAADRMDQFSFKWIVYLFPQAAHDQIDYVRIRLESYVPHMFCNFIARYHFTHRMRQVGEQEKLFGCEIQWNSAALGALMPCIDFQIVDTQLVPTCRSTPHKRTHARKQFGKRERFHHVIVRAELEPFHAIAHTVARRQKNDRRLHPGLAQFFDESPAIFFRKHDIDNEKVKLAQACRRQ